MVGRRAEDEQSHGELFLQDFFSLFDGVRDLTTSMNRDESERWVIRLGLCFAVFLSVGEIIPKEESPMRFLNTAAYSRYIELQTVMWWTAYGIFCGAYDSAVRDMRYVLESMLGAYYVDKSNDEKPFADRLDALRRNKLRGRRLIRRCALPQEVEESAVQLFGRLSGFVHPGKEALRTSGHFTDFGRFFKYNLYAECMGYYDRVQDLVLAVLFSGHRLAGITFLQKGNVKEKLESLKYKHTLNVCRD